jgi:hypothetical protein
MTEWFYITALGDQNLILGLPWLEKHNPIINWKEKTLEFRSSPEDKAKSVHSESSLRTRGDNAYRGQRSCGMVPEVTQGT